MEASIELRQAMSFSAQSDSGFTVELGADREVGGDDDGFRPMELMLISLGACTAMDVISILRKKRQHITGFEVQLDAERADEHPKIFTDILVRYIIHGVDVDPKAVTRSIELSETKYCPAQAMLVRAVPIRHEFQIVEDADGTPAI